MANASTISKQSSLSIGLMLVLLGAFGAGAFYVGGFAQRAESHYAKMESRMDVLESRLVDRWTRTDAREYHETLQLLNGDIRVPPIAQPAAGR